MPGMKAEPIWFSKVAYGYASTTVLAATFMIFRVSHVTEKKEMYGSL